MYKDYSTKAQIIKDLRGWHNYWKEMAWLVHSDTTRGTLAAKWQNAKDYILAMEKEMEEKGSCGGVGFPYHIPTATECIKILSGGLLDDEETQAQVKWKNRQDRLRRKRGKAQGGSLRAWGKATSVSDKWPEAVRQAIFSKLHKTYSHVPTTPRPEKSTTRQRAPRSHHRVAVSTRGGDSGDDESGESDPPAPPLSWRSCPYHRLPSHNPPLLEPLQLFPCGDVSRGRYRRRSFVVDFGRCAA